MPPRPVGRADRRLFARSRRPASVTELDWIPYRRGAGSAGSERVATGRAAHVRHSDHPVMGGPVCRCGVAQPGIVPLRSLTVKPSSVWRSATSMSSWCMAHSPSPPRRSEALPGAGTRPARGSAGPRPVSWTVTTMRPGVAQMRTVAGGRPWRCALLTASVTPISRSSSVVAGLRLATDLRERVPGFGGGSVDQLDDGAESSSGSGAWGQAFEDQRVLVAVAGPALSRRRDDARVGSLDDVEHRLGRGGGVVQAPAPDREVLPDGVDRRIRSGPIPRTAPRCPDAARPRRSGSARRPWRREIQTAAGRWRSPGPGSRTGSDRR